MSVINQNLLLTPEGYQISRSVRLRSSASAYFNRTPASATNRKTWTWSGWVKRGKLGAEQSIFGVGPASTNKTELRFQSNDTLLLTCGNAGSTGLINTTAVFRDPSAWYHVALAFDTTQAISSNRAFIYINGVLQATTVTTALTLNGDYNVNSTDGHWISGDGTKALANDCYLTEVNFIDGQALTPSSFGETDSITGVWKPKKYAGTYGTNGFYLNFSDNSAATAAAIGKDSSGNGNNWTPNNISVTSGVTYDSMLDVPTMYADGGNGRGNYCVLSPLDKDSGNTVVDGNLKVTTSSSGQGFQRATMFVNSGKWYWEVLVSSASGNSSIGIAGQNTTTSTSNYIGATSDSYGYVATNGNKYNNGSSAAYGATYTTGNVIGVALDMDAGTLTFYKDNASQGTAYSSLSGYFAPALSDVSNSSSSVFDANFGQRPFAYTPPTGFKALNTQNLPDATIKKGNAYFDVTTYTGNGSTQSITNSGAMQPDFVWMKKRSAAESHILQNSTTGTTKFLISNSTAAEDTSSAIIQSFDSGGFTVGSSSVVNGAATTYAAWQWKESASAGFDIVTYTGTASSLTVNHSLGVAPAMIIAKSRGTAGTNWGVWHKNLTAASYYLLLNSTAAQATAANTIQSTPTSTSVSLGDSSIFNAASSMVMYLFAEVAGFSKFGSYTGNGSSDGPFVYCGFRPRFLLIKISSTTGSWTMVDTSRDTYNLSTKGLYADLSDAEDSSRAIDILSNGFKIRSATANNTSGATHIFAAFAENPFKNSLAR